MKRRFLFLPFLLTACQTGPGLRTPSAAPRFGFTQLKELILKERLAGVDDLLEKLAQSRPSLLENHVYMHESFSLQHATPENPRALIFTDQADFIFSFNGDPQLPGYGTIETTERDAAGNYFFREIRFKREAPAVPPDDDTAPFDQETELVSFSVANPPKCTQCHGSSPRPNWEPYFIWPGAYGAEDDNLFREKTSVVRQFKLVPGAPDREREAFLKFLETGRQRPRYRALIRSDRLGEDDQRPLLQLTAALFTAELDRMIRDLQNALKDPQRGPKVEAALCRYQPFNGTAAGYTAEMSSHEKLALSFLQEISAAVHERTLRLMRFHGESIVPQPVPENACTQIVLRKLPPPIKASAPVLAAAQSTLADRCQEVFALLAAQPVFEAAGLDPRGYALGLRRAPEFEDGRSSMVGAMSVLRAMVENNPEGRTLNCAGQTP